MRDDGRPRRGHALVMAAASAALLSVVAFDPALLRPGRPLDGEVTQVLGAVSLAADRDLSDDRDDVAGAVAFFGVVPDRLLLRRTAAGAVDIPASLPHAALAALLVPWAGARAFVLLHVAGLVVAALVAWARLAGRREGPTFEPGALLVLSPLPLWTLRFTPEAFEAALVLAGTALLVPRADPDRSAYGGRSVAAWGGAVLLGLAVGHRPLPLFVLCAVPWIVAGPRRGPVGGLAGAGVVAAIGLACAVLSGVPSSGISETEIVTADGPRGHLVVLLDAIPDEAGGGLERAREIRPPVTGARLDELGPALRDAFLGRFGGVLVYFPGVVAALVAACARRDPRRLGLLAVLAIGVVALAWARPHTLGTSLDAFGLRGAVGLYPLAIVAGVGALGAAGSAVLVLLAALFLAEPLATPAGTLGAPGRHAVDAPYTWLPPDASRAGGLPRRVDPLAPYASIRVQHLDDHHHRIEHGCAWMPDPGDQPAGCFWTRGDRPMALLLWSVEPLAELRVHVRAGLVPTIAKIAVGGRHATTKLAAGEAYTARVHPGAGTPYRRGERTWHIYPIEVRSERGFYPELAGGGRDDRWLGVHVGLGVTVDRGQGAAAVPGDVAPPDEPAPSGGAGDGATGDGATGDDATGDDVYGGIDLRERG